VGDGPTAERPPPAGGDFVDGPIVDGPIVLVGLMATGKTTIGRCLAARLGLEFRDSDEDIEREAGGRTVADLAAAEGAAGMHRREAGHLLAALAGRRPIVVAAAASTVDDPRCTAALLEPAVTAVWLRASVATIAARFRSGPHRPTFGREPPALLADQARQREPRFARVADLVVDIDGRSPSEIVEGVVAGLAAGLAGAPSALGES
jgi:shikimate kinase